MNGRVAEDTEVSRRFRLVLPSTALVLGVLALLLLGAQIPLAILDRRGADALSGAAYLVFALSFTVVGVVVARREPRNPIGWLMILLTLSVLCTIDGGAYAYLDYKFHHGALPLGHVAVLLTPGWVPGVLIAPLIVLLFPDGRLGPSWRWPLRAYLVLAAAFIVGTLSVCVAAFSLRMPVDSALNVAGLNQPTGANAWVGPVQDASYLALALLVIASVLHQARGYRRATGERRQQLKWLSSGAAVCVAVLAMSALWTAKPAWVGEAAFPVTLSCVPLAMGIGILKYRLYEIDRLISRTLSYSILTALLVGIFIGLVALTTNTLAFSGRVGVAASTLAAAALFNPLRKRIQRLVDRRFNRDRYDAEATVAAFTARLRDAVELDAIRADLLDTVNRAVQPSHASVWMRPHARS
jgi:hypothetical protein